MILGESTILFCMVEKHLFIKLIHSAYSLDMIILNSLLGLFWKKRLFEGIISLRGSVNSEKHVTSRSKI